MNLVTGPVHSSATHAGVDKRASTNSRKESVETLASAGISLKLAYQSQKLHTASHLSCADASKVCCAKPELISSTPASLRVCACLPREQRRRPLPVHADLA